MQLAYPFFIEGIRIDWAVELRTSWSQRVWCFCRGLGFRWSCCCWLSRNHPWSSPISAYQSISNFSQSTFRPTVRAHQFVGSFYQKDWMSSQVAAWGWCWSFKFHWIENICLLSSSKGLAYFGVLMSWLEYLSLASYNYRSAFELHSSFIP